MTHHSSAEYNVHHRLRCTIVIFLQRLTQLFFEQKMANTKTVSGKNQTVADDSTESQIMKKKKIQIVDSDDDAKNKVRYPFHTLYSRPLSLAPPPSPPSM